MDLFVILEQYGIPICVAVAFGFFIWKQNKYIQDDLTKDLLYDHDLTPDQYVFSSPLISNLTNNIRNLNLYKFIMYDSTILGTTQNDSLASQIDGTILVVPLNKINKGLFKSKLKRLKEKNIFILGIILNNLS